MKSKRKKIICPTCKQDMTEPPRDDNSGEDCPQCGQGLSKSRLKRIRTHDPGEIGDEWV